MQDNNDKSFVLYDEVGTATHEDLPSSSDLNELFNELDSGSVDLLGDPKDFADRKDEDVDDVSDLDLSAGALEKSNDSMPISRR